MEKKDAIIFKTVLGNIKVFSINEVVVLIKFTNKKIKNSNSEILNRSKNQIKEYLLGKRTVFNLDTKPEGSIFQKRVWKQLSLIPYSKTVSYLTLSAILKTSPRAIGNACGKNPLLIIIPCHRVLSVKGKLTGFSALGGIKTKEKLLKIEAIKI
jgi:methylated-DNA-[protein]-cysteine S-methyltransferase